MDIINPIRVREIVKNCLFTDEELKQGEEKKGYIEAKGIMCNLGFNPKRVEEYKSEIENMLKLLPHTFREKEGGGWSFLNLCNQEDGLLWTGEQRTMDLLVCLGIAIKKAQWLMKEMMSSLPGGMPYVVLMVTD